MVRLSSRVRVPRVASIRPLWASCAIALLATSAVPRSVLACGACRGAGGAGGALTAADERWNVTLATMARTEIGSWDWSGRVHAQPASVAAQDLSAQLAVAVRVIRPLELSITGGAGISHLSAPGLDTIGGGATDLALRARFDVLAEDPSHATRPAMSTWLTVRAPTGGSVEPAYGSTAGAVGAFGLGAWEFALGADFRRTFAERWQPFVALEGALRAPDESAGYARALGPRGSARVGVTFFASDVFALSAT